MTRWPFPATLHPCFNKACKIKISAPVFWYSSWEFFKVRVQTPEGFSPQWCKVKIVQLASVVAAGELSLGRRWVRRDVVPCGDVRLISRSPLRVNVRLTLTWTCSKKFIIFPGHGILISSREVFTRRAPEEGISLWITDTFPLSSKHNVYDTECVACECIVIRSPTNNRRLSYLP